MGHSEARTLRLLEVHNQLIHGAVAEYHGTVIKTVGDAFLVDFPSVVHAVQCAQRIQEQFRTYNAAREHAEQIHVRIGVHIGDVVQHDGDVFGDGVNIAARLQQITEPDTICLSDMVYRDVAKKLDLGTIVSLGRPKLKNIAERFPIYGLLSEPPTGFRQTLQVQRLKLKPWRRPVQVAVVVLVLVWAGVVTRKIFFPSPSPGQPRAGTSLTSQPVLPLPDKPSIVVLPFANMSNDPEQEYFSDGITEDLTSDLSKLSGLFVIARNSAFAHKGKAVKVQEVGQELGVRYVLEGSVRKMDEQVRITAQLVDAATGQHLWTERYDRPLTGIFVVQDEITQQIAVHLNVEMWEAERERVKRIPTENLNAYDAFLRGFEYFLRGATKETHAQEMCERAIELDPQYAAAYQALGGNYFLEWAAQWSQDPQTLEQALALVQKAITLDESLSWAHATLGNIYLWKKQHEQALAEGERAVALDPNSEAGYVALGDILNFSGRPADALEAMEKAMRLNPRYPPFYLRIVGTAYYLSGRYEEAIEAYKKVLTRNPNWLLTHVNLALLYSELGREQEAGAEVAEVLRLSPNFSLEGVRRTWPYKDSAVLERALAALRKAGLK